MADLNTKFREGIAFVRYLTILLFMDSANKTARKRPWFITVPAELTWNGKEAHYGGGYATEEAARNGMEKYRKLGGNVQGCVIKYKP